jgi:SAM-dependent methyltransferase
VALVADTGSAVLIAHLCRACGAPLTETFVDLGATPLANSYLEPADADLMEPHYPLHARVCGSCLLVQLPAVQTAEAIFSDYAYFSSYADSWVEHARRYVAAIVPALGLGPESLVVEIASNDGYLLRHVVQAGVGVLGVEPAANVAAAAIAAGVDTEISFFGRAYAEDLVQRRGHADLIVANNVLAHVPDLNDFVAGIAVLLAPGGRVTVEAPHLLRLIRHRQFDTIYHEHFSYLSLLATSGAVARHGLTVVDVEELPTHGGSLRYHLAHAAAGVGPDPRVAQVLADERAAGMDRVEGYGGFADACADVKTGLLGFLIDARRAGRRVAAYGAPAKGNTLLSYCGVGPELVEYTVDRSPAKQGRLLPGSRIPVHAPERLRTDRPDDILILPWNLRDEIAGQLADVVALGSRLVVAVPELEVIA